VDAQQQTSRVRPEPVSLAEFKSHFYTGLEFITLNNSGQGLIPDTNRDLAKYWLDRMAIEGPSCAMEAWAATETTRKKLARFLGADEQEIAFFTTTSAALSQVAWGLPLESGEEILTWDQEYPSNFYPWRQAAAKSGAHLIQVESKNFETPIEAILQRVTQKTKAIAISWVQYQSGAVTDMKELSRQLKGKNIWLIADVIQGAGVRPLDFKATGFDVFCGGSHKFMCSGYGHKKRPHPGV
jgi:cysteine desulfurase / selenocysteine lyase